MTDVTTLIAQSGKTRSEIIKEAEISQAFLSLIEKGERKVGLRTVIKLAGALNVQPSALRPDLAEVFKDKAKSQKDAAQ